MSNPLCASTRTCHGVSFNCHGASAVATVLQPVVEKMNLISVPQENHIVVCLIGHTGSITVNRRVTGFKPTTRSIKLVL